MNGLVSVGNPIVAKRRRLPVAIAAAVLLTLTGCYPKYDWRDHRPDCARAWCGFVATFPGKPTSATREIPVGAQRLPLSATIVTVGEVSFALLSFELRPDSDAAAARAVLEKKLLDDVGASAGRATSTSIHAADRGEVRAAGIAAEGVRDGRHFAATARMAERRGRLIEVLVIGPVDELATGSGRQAVDTFMTSVRLD